MGKLPEGPETGGTLSVAAVGPTTSSETTRLVALACIVAGTVLFLAYVAYRLRQRMRCACCCLGADPAAAHRAALLTVAAQLYKAAAADKDFQLRPLIKSRRWRATLPAAFLPPTLAPEEMGALRSPRSPAAAAAHLQLLTAGSAWSHASEAPALPPAEQPQLRPPPVPFSQPEAGSPGNTLGRTPTRTSTVGAATASSAAAAAAAAADGGGSPTARGWPGVRDLVRTWGRARTRGQEGPTDVVGAADVVLGGAGGRAGRYGAADLESQKGEAPCLLPSHSRALTWSQLGIAHSTAGSRHTSMSESYTPPSALLQPPSSRHPPRSQQHATPTAQLLQGEVHGNPVFVPWDWASMSGVGGSISQGEASVSPATGSFTGPTGSFTGGAVAAQHGVRRTPSRLSRLASFVEPVQAGSLVAAAGASQQSLMYSQAELEGLGRIQE